MEIKTTEFFKNIKHLPPKDSDEYNQLVDWEISKITGGITVNGVYISGWLYWHLNHWWIRVDELDEDDNIIRVPRLPELRDNEWIRAEYLEQCKRDKKGYMEVGGRQSGKSEMEASYFGMNATIFENTQNLIVCGNDDDLSLLKDKVDFGLKRLWKGIAIPRLDKTWRLNQIRLGYKDVSGEDQIWSYIIIRNARDGHNTEAGAGTTAKTVIFDEVGKYLFASAFKAVEPAIKSKFGWRAVPIMVGTGGSFQNGKDAENFFYNPDANNFLSVVDEKTNKKTAIFLSGLYRLDCKEEVKLGDWLRSRGMNIEDVSELNNLIIAVSNKEKAKELIGQEREQAKTNPDRTLFLKQKMYYPLTTDECFLTEQQNIFDIDACKRQQARLFAEGRVGTPVIMMNDGEKIVHSFTDKQPISNFPVKPEDDKDAPIIIYEFPVENAPYGLYTAGVDSYRSGQAKYSTSLGTVYIYKRMTSITGEKYQNVLVASYAARPDKKEKWEEQARLLIKYYNARTLVENDEISFIDYMVAKGDARYLESQPEWLKEIVPNTTVKRDFGIHRSAEKVRNFLHSCLKKYTEEIVYQEKDESGNIVKEVLGITRMFDPMLLEEMIHYNDDDNFDRVIACFTQEARILTEQGYKFINQVTLGDKVLTHNGVYKQVLSTSKNKIIEDLINIKPLGEDSTMTCTKEHPFLIRNVERGKGRNWFKNTKIGGLEWKKAANLTLNDHLVVPTRKNLSKTELNSELLYILGWYLSDGNRGRNNVKITFQEDQLHIATYIKELLLKYDDFGKIYVDAYNWKSKKIVTGYRKRKPPRIKKIKNKRAYNLDFNSTYFNKIIDDNITILAGGEKIIKDKLFNSNNLLPLVLGFLEGDGHQKSTFTTESKYSRETIEVSGVYHTLLRQIKQILLDNHIWCTSNLNKQKNPNSRTQLRLDIQDQGGINKIIDSISGGSRKFKRLSVRDQKKFYFFIDNDFIVPIKYLKTLKSQDVFVYNIEVEEHNSYTVNSFAVHNCELAIALAMKLDPLFGAVGNDDRKYIPIKKRKAILFPETQNRMLKKRKQRLFL